MQIGGQWRHVLSAHRARDHHRCDGFSRHRRDSWRPRSTQGRNNTEGYRRREERTDANDLQHPSDRGAADTRSMKKPASSFQLAASSRYKRLLNFPGTWHLAPSISSRGFTLIETLVAVTLLSVAITAPMSLTTRSLAAAYYARDQITAFHLAQEAIESVRHARDHNIL